MKRTIDDLPMVRVATLMALAEIGRDAKTARVRFGDDGVAYQVGVRLRRFRNGGFWALFLCPRCGRGAQRLRLLEDAPACGKCVRASGLIYRSQATRTEKRHLVTAPPRLARLNSDKPLRVHPRPGRMLDRRATPRERCEQYYGTAACDHAVAPQPLSGMGESAVPMISDGGTFKVPG